MWRVEPIKASIDCLGIGNERKTRNIRLRDAAARLIHQVAAHTKFARQELLWLIGLYSKLGFLGIGRQRNREQDRGQQQNDPHLLRESYAGANGVLNTAPLSI